MKKHAGFTLIELIIGIAIMLIIFGGIVYIFSASSKSAIAGMNHKQAYESARTFMDEIKTTMRYADTINLNSSNGTLTYAVNYDTATGAVQHPFYEEHFSKDIANGKACYYNYKITWNNSEHTQLKIVRSVTPVKEGTTDKDTALPDKTFYFPENNYVSSNGAFTAKQYKTDLDSGAFANFPVIEKDLTNSGTKVYGIAIPIQYKDATGTNKVDILQTEVQQATDYKAYDVNNNSGSKSTAQTQAEILLNAVTAMYGNENSDIVDELRTGDKNFTNNISSGVFNQKGIKGITINLKNYIDDNDKTGTYLDTIGTTAWVIAALDADGKVIPSGHPSAVYGWRVFIAKNAVNDVDKIYTSIYKKNSKTGDKAYYDAAMSGKYIVRPEYGVLAYTYTSDAKNGTIKEAEQIGYMSVINISDIIMLDYTTWVSDYTKVIKHDKISDKSGTSIEDSYSGNKLIAGTRKRIDYDGTGVEYILSNHTGDYSYPPNGATGKTGQNT